MYSELLSVLYEGVESDELPPSPEELVVILLQCRTRLHRRSMGYERRMADDLAFQLDHDRFDRRTKLFLPASKCGRSRPCVGDAEEPDYAAIS